MWFQEVYVIKTKISNFLKTPVFSITLTFINDYVLNVDDIKEFWSFGLCWSLLAFIAFLDFATLDESIQAKSGIFWQKLSIIDLYATIRC